MTEEPRTPWEGEHREQPHVWRTLGYRRVPQGGGQSVVVHRTKRVVFCAGGLQDTAGELLASARCTQVLRSRR